jgi:hypothetical protein
LVLIEGEPGEVPVFRYIWSLKWSLVAVAGAILASFLSLGMLGYVLYYLAYPVVGLAYPPLTAWRAAAVWPLIIGAGVAWSLSFLPAGVIDHALAARGISPGRRRISYLLVLWIGAIAAWSFLIATSLPAARQLTP